jgi:lipopolysaccharide export system permease protein
LGKEIVVSFLVAYLVCFVVLFVNIILVLASNLENKNVSLPDILLLVVLWMPRIMYLAFPYSSIIGALMAAGRLSSDNEYISFLSCGVSLRRLTIPFVLVGLLAGVATFFVGDFLIPSGMTKFNDVYLSLIRKNPRMELEPNAVRRFNDLILVTGNIDKNTIYNIIIYDKTPEKNLKRIIYADKAIIQENAEQNGVISFELLNVVAQTPDPSIIDKYEYLFAQRMLYNILLNDPDSGVRNPSPEEMSLTELSAQIKTKEEELEKRYTGSLSRRNKLILQVQNQYFASLGLDFLDAGSRETGLTEMQRNWADYVNLSKKPDADYLLRYQYYKYYDKFAVPVACLIMMLGFPMGLFSKRSGRVFGMILGFGFAVLYYALTILLQTAGLQLKWDPVFVIWVPNVILLALFGYFFYRRSKS